MSTIQATERVGGASPQRGLWLSIDVYIVHTLAAPTREALHFLKQKASGASLDRFVVQFSSCSITMIAPLAALLSELVAKTARRLEVVRYNHPGESLSWQACIFDREGRRHVWRRRTCGICRLNGKRLSCCSMSSVEAVLDLVDAFNQQGTDSDTASMALTTSATVADHCPHCRRCVDPLAVSQWCCGECSLPLAAPQPTGRPTSREISALCKRCRWRDLVWAAGWWHHGLGALRWGCHRRLLRTKHGEGCRSRRL